LLAGVVRFAIAAGAGVGDVIQVDAALFADLAAIQASAQQVGSSTVITLDAASTITLTGVSASSLNANDSGSSEVRAGAPAPAAPPG
jgi:hypothetical protein